MKIIRFLILLVLILVLSSCSLMEIKKGGDGSLGITGDGKTLAWDTYAEKDRITGFKIYHSVDKVNFEAKGTTDKNATSFSIDNLTKKPDPKVANYFRITAYNATHESAPSNTVCWGDPCSK